MKKGLLTVISLLIFFVVTLRAQDSNSGFYSYVGENSNLYGFKNDSTGQIIEAEYDDVFEFNEGIACVNKEEKWGYINTSGKLVLPIIYTRAYPFFEGLAVVQMQDGGK
jgi:hypothetical protein